MRRAFWFLVVAVAVATPAAADDPLPAPTKAQFKASADNLERIGLAFFDYQEVNQFIPNNVYRDGKALLSWRVLLLPYLGELALFTEFKLDEAWDGATNKALVEKMPKVYAPVRVRAKAGETFYRGFVTDRGPFGPRVNMTLRISTIRDGASNTGLVFEAGEPVTWTKPDDLPFPAKGPLPKLGGLFGGVAQVVMADGEVKTLRANPDPAELRKLIDPDDGQTIDYSKLLRK